MSLKNYRIIVKTLTGQILTFTVKEYEVQEGFVIFTDRVTGKIKSFPVVNCEIEGENNNEAQP